MSISSRISSGDNFGLTPSSEDELDLTSTLNMNGLVDDDADSDDNDNYPHNTINAQESDDSDGDDSKDGVTGPFKDLNLTLDPSADFSTWSKERNVALIDQLLEISDPMLTDGMLNFLNSEGVLDLLLDNMLLKGQERMKENTDSTIINKSFKVLNILAPQHNVNNANQMGQTSQSLPQSNRVLLTENAAVILKKVTEGFKNDSGGNFYHLAAVVDYYLTNLPEVFLGVAGKNAASVRRFLGPIFSCLGENAVGELILKLVTLQTPLTWKYRLTLSDTKVLLTLTQTACRNKDEDSFRVIKDLIGKLRIDSGGEILLNPLGYCEVVETLVECGEGGMDVVNYVMEMMEGDEVGIPQGQFGGEIRVDNQLKPLRSKIAAMVEAVKDKVIDRVLAAPANPLAPVKHTSGAPIIPFTSSRLEAVELLARIVRLKGSEVKPEVWTKMGEWYFTYSENDLYHHHFYNILHTTLLNCPDSLKSLVKDGKFITEAVKNYEAEGPFNRGSCLRCLNSVRLKIEGDPPSTFLRQYLSSHDQWKSFLPKLVEQTISNLKPGNGISVPGESGFGVEESVGLGSEFARDLGFDGEAYVAEEGAKRKRKKKKKKKKKGGNESSGTEESTEESEGGDDDEE
ncbi:hypothetical protein TrLO_g11667 [Triparma laevis f. longispina]|uniref:Uncharacterized protein n=1 Tax=Triparma laevis f. longispina TaxID=1714387 RepID=A0A9W7CH42_9STRA|nr:hypothetical protein TrLO_g11667 [Triparma laevis f. longispina]